MRIHTKRESLGKETWNDDGQLSGNQGMTFIAWMNLVDQQVEIYRQPKGLEYVDKQVLRGDDAISPGGRRNLCRIIGGLVGREFT